jgi:hypothetical protein
VPEPEPRRSAGCVAGALLILGFLILIPSGLCTGATTIFPILVFLFNPKHPSIPTGIIPMALMFGGPFILLGIFLIWCGRALSKR